MSMQVKRVIDPEAEALRLAEMRRLQRQMKGVKLQYIAENDDVFFDDVAGIGEAKVGLVGCSLLLARPQHSTHPTKHQYVELVTQLSPVCNPAVVRV